MRKIVAEVLNRRIDIRRVGERSEEAARDFGSRHVEWAGDVTVSSELKKTAELRFNRSVLI
jgi:hypothetical protein